GESESTSGEETTHTGHELVEVNAVLPIPTIEVNVELDPVSGWNVHADVENFEFSPENAGGTPQDGKGHAHLYVDGVKIARMYGEWYHIPTLTSGNHYVSVALNTNDHHGLAHEGVAIQDGHVVSVPETYNESETALAGNVLQSYDDQVWIPILFIVGLLVFAFFIGAYGNSLAKE
ncbi:MAG: hypothetical protein AABY11_01730, partial [archaeon]